MSRQYYRFMKRHHDAVFKTHLFGPCPGNLGSIMTAGAARHLYLSGLLGTFGSRSNSVTGLHDSLKTRRKSGRPIFGADLLSTTLRLHIKLIHPRALLCMECMSSIPQERCRTISRLRERTARCLVRRVDGGNLFARLVVSHTKQ